ncbi:MAG: hypothetical protein PHX62_03655 [Bacilli bacterium]|nr:hypothetical protein [Bacilli bacterium]
MIEQIINISSYIFEIAKSLWFFLQDIISLFVSLITTLPQEIASFLTLTFIFGLAIGFIVFIRKII